MKTALIINLMILCVIISLVLALGHQRVRLLVGGVMFIILTAASDLAAFSCVFFRARAPVPNDVLLFRGTSHTVFALKASDATRRWSHSLPSSLNLGVVTQDGVVYASTASGVYALATNNGHQLWHSPTAIIVQPGSIGNGVIVGSSSIAIESANQFAAINASNGQPLWQVPVSMN